MKKIFLISIILVATSLTANANQKHKNLPRSEKIEKNTDLRLVNVIKDEKEITSTKLKKKLKLNTDSKLTDLLTGKNKKKIKLNTDSKLTDLLTGKNEKKIKLNTDSTLTDLLTGKKKVKIPNPMNGLKKIGKALKPDNPLK